MQNQKNKSRVSNMLKMAVCASLAGVFMSACATYQSSVGPTVARNKITVAETVERLELYVGPAGLHLSSRDQDAVADFLAGYANTGEGPLYMNVPSNAMGNQGVRQAQNVITSFLTRMGMSGAAIQSGQYPSIPGAPAPVIVSYRHLATAPIDCQMGAALTQTSNNQAYENFGCAQTANLAALIDNPRQLLAPYAFDNASAVRRMKVIESYNNAEPTATPRPDGQTVSVTEDG